MISPDNQTLNDIKKRAAEYDRLDAYFEETKNESIKWNTEYLKLIQSYDSRYLKSDIATAMGAEPAWNLHRVMRMMDGVYFAYTININGDKKKVRLLTVKEFESLQLETMELMEKRPLLKAINGMYDIMLQRKVLSLATSVYIPRQDLKGYDNPAYRGMTENDIAELPQAQFDRMWQAYSIIENTYNCSPDETSAEDLERFIAVATDEKKTSEEEVDRLLTGLDLFQSQKVAKGFWKMIILLKGNIQFGTSLEDSITEA
jgi:hypothetical protein